MNYWIFPCNVNLYDPFSAFKELGEVDWRQSAKVQEGDEVFIYCSKPYSKIMFRTKAIEVNIPTSKANDSDLKFSKNNKQIGNTPKFGYVRLRLISFKDCKELSLDVITKHGIIKAPQGPMKMSDELHMHVSNYL